MLINIQCIRISICLEVSYFSLLPEMLNYQLWGPLAQSVELRTWD